MHLQTDEIMEILCIGGQLFVRISKPQYSSLIDENEWGQLIQVCLDMLPDNNCRKEVENLVTLPSFEVIQSTQNNLFTSGMALAALPIESLYMVWVESGETPFGRVRGLYQADSAYHIRSVYERVGVEIPKAFKATPDHLTLLLELVVILLNSGNIYASAQIAQDHFSWLDSYKTLLSKRTKEVLSIEGYTQAHRESLKAGILFYRSLVGLIFQVLIEVQKLPKKTNQEASEY